MKTLNKLYLIFVIIFMFLSSCVTEADMWERTYQVKNNTGYDVTFRAFKNYTGIGPFEDITILDGDIFIGETTSGSNFDYINDPNNLDPTSSYDFIRFIVIYNNERSAICSVDFDDNDSAIFSSPIVRNLFRGGNYTDIGNDIYEFVLTEEDYNNAIPCDGDCLD